MYFAAGDGPFYFAQMLRKLGWFPVIWRADEGFGVNHGFRLWYDYALQLVIKILSEAGLNWWWIDKLLWFGAIATALYASYSFGKYFFKKPYAYLTPVVYVFNTYFLLLFSGGQLGVTLAYAYFPLVLIQFIRSLEESRRFSLSQAVRRGLSLALLTIFDLRFAYLLIAALALYHLLYRIKHGIKGFWVSVMDVGVAFVITLGVHAFWIVPTLLMGGAGVGGLDNEIINPGMLRFLSFADFSHALSLLHPNWPENFFGKVYFLQPEFLVIPILAFASLFFTKRKSDNLPRWQAGRSRITFFALLVLLGAFSAKGVQEPFGGVYAWMFTHIPGFVMFRDPTKFYIYIALSYSVLIPFMLERVNKKIALFVFAIFWLFTVRAVFMGEVEGNFRPLHLPTEYIQLKDLVVSDSVPSRTLWIPQREKFSYASDTHPLLFADQLFSGASVSAVIKLAGTPDFMTTLAAAGVRYVVVPLDLEQRLFLNDYRFDSGQRGALITALKNTPLVQIPDFHDVAVFENNTFTFVSAGPVSLTRQQRLTDIGLAISVISLATCAGVLVIRRKK
jgi:hypothetical protein